MLITIKGKPRLMLVNFVHNPDTTTQQFIRARLELHPMPSPPNKPLESMAKNSHPLRNFPKLSMMISPLPMVSWSNTIYGFSISLSLERASLSF
jgi:hypothetical protein